VVIAPTDRHIYSAQSFAFATANETAAIELMGRTEADGGGHTGYNMALTPGNAVRSWFTVDGQSLGSNAHGDTPHFRSRGYSLQGGLDASVGATGRIGAAIGYGQTHFRDAVGGTGHDDALRASLVASQPIGPIGFSALISYAHGRETTRRETGIGQAYAKHNLNQLTGGVQAVAPFTWHGVIATPAVGVLVSRVSGGDFIEQGNIPAAFRVAADVRTRSFISPYGTFQLAYPVTDAGGTIWTPDIEIGFRHSNAARGSAVTLTAADGTVFEDNRIDLARNNVLTGASLTAHKGQWTGFVTYRGQIADGWTDNSATVGFRLAF
jgi:hypothetical protein